MLEIFAVLFAGQELYMKTLEKHWEESTIAFQRSTKVNLYRLNADWKQKIHPHPMDLAWHQVPSFSKVPAEIPHQESLLPAIGHNGEKVV